MRNTTNPTRAATLVSLNEEPSKNVTPMPHNRNMRNSEQPGFTTDSEGWVWDAAGRLLDVPDDQRWPSSNWLPSYFDGAPRKFTTPNWAATRLFWFAEQSAWMLSIASFVGAFVIIFWIDPQSALGSIFVGFPFAAGVLYLCWQLMSDIRLGRPYASLWNRYSVDSGSHRRRTRWESA